MTEKVVRQYRRPGKWKVELKCEGEREEQNWLGVVRAEEKGDYELEMVVTHEVSKSKARVVVRAVAAEGARVKLRGMIRIPPGKKEIVSGLELRILLLDDESRGEVEPRLEIASHEVKVSHKASVSKIDEKQLRYLMSRGLTQLQAKREIIEGWLIS